MNPDKAVYKLSLSCLVCWHLAQGSAHWCENFYQLFLLHYGQNIIFPPTRALWQCKKGCESPEEQLPFYLMSLVLCELDDPFKATLSKWVTHEHRVVLLVLLMFFSVSHHAEPHTAVLPHLVRSLFQNRQTSHPLLKYNQTCNHMDLCPWIWIRVSNSFRLHTDFFCALLLG